MGDKSVFASWLRRERQARGLTQDDLAERVGCVSQTIRKLEGGQRRPSYQMAERLALVLQLDSAERSAWMRAARELDEEAPPPAAPAICGGVRIPPFSARPRRTGAEVARALHPPILCPGSHRRSS
jgi:transcriptional regulator with XRE-family HTH domain